MEKYKRACAKIDLDALDYNINSIKNAIQENSEIVAVIKTDGYGHGAIPLGKRLDGEEKVWGFAVATAEEADILRKAGIHKPILIIGAVFSYAYEMMLCQQVRLTVFSYEVAQEISKEAERLGETAKIHIKLDTGMARIGFLPNEEALAEIKKIAKLPNVEIEGVFTHFAKADETDKTSANHQFVLFTDFIEKMAQVGIEPTVKHCSNSAGITDLPEVNMDLVRAGIILYGLMPSEEIDKKKVPVKPLMSLESHIVHVKKIPAMTGVSYGHTYVTKEERVLATIPVGYGDGYPRSLSNKGYVLIHGQYAKICGRVCMDQMMVDVTDIPDVKVGDLATLLGTNGTHTITAEEIGDLSGRFNYEFVCDIGKRVPRLYMEKGKPVACKDYYKDTEIEWL